MSKIQHRLKGVWHFYAQNLANSLAISYAIFASLWILSSDFWLLQLGLNAEQLTRAQNFKGLAFISLSAGLIWIMVYSGQQQLKLALQAEQLQAQLLKRLSQQLPQALFHFDQYRRCFTVLSPVIEDLLGIKPNQLQQQPMSWFASVDKQQRPRLLHQLKECIDERAPANLEFRIRNSDKTLLLQIYPVGEGNQRALVGSVEDITQQVLQKQRLTKASQHDILTTLPNRMALKQELLRRCIAHERFHLLLIDLDHFRAVNDSLGHNTGDRLLRKIADRLSQHYLPHAWLARIGGDEFALLHPWTQHQEELAAKIIELISQPLTINGQTNIISASIGLASSPDHGQEPSSLMRKADIALHAVKANGRRHWQSYHKDISIHGLGILQLESQLQRAVSEQQFEVVIQPKYSVPYGNLIGGELLLRWRHPEHGIWSPAKFIIQLESMPLMQQVGWWVLLQGLQVLKEWQLLGWRHLRLSVNIAAKQLQSEQWIDELEHRLLDLELNPDCLELEITENALLENPDQAAQCLQRLKNLGIKIALDDFGTGYSSLSYLKRFAPDVIKIDKSFLQILTTDHQALTIVEHSVRMAHGLYMMVVAEGVETQKQLQLIKEIGCDAMQGYFASKPIEISAFNNQDCLQNLYQHQDTNFNPLASVLALKAGRK